MRTVALVDPDGHTTDHELADPPALYPPGRSPRSRIAYAAAHVIPRATGDNVPGAPADVDWDSTLAFRHHLWSWGLGVADAMDTAQRNMGLDAGATRELITRTAAEASSVGGALVVGVNTDHLATETATLSEIADAYVEQLQFAEDHGAGVVLMASRHLARAASSAAEYEWVYRQVLDRAGAPVVLHWLGEAFDPQLAGYFGADPAATVLRIMNDNLGRVRGIKVSLLDAGREVDLRARLPHEITMFTGDDYHYVSLIEGDGQQHSDALLGAFAAIAPLASAALQALDEGDVPGYRRILGPTEALSQQIFAAPTSFYKTGVAFMSWLNGHQPAFAMVGGLHAARSLPHLSRIVRLADAAGALTDPALAAQRWNALLAVHGLGDRVLA
ncbi:dihydrodipicolinate synthase family protein [Pseudonocardia kujensis]|uniref:dihydrodipicolinate synthase family protein n=1 Tax=Pseudonocardia kujensis TaxID=1128675 RepID=UPI001E534C39|nr:dihydrodipicolinate synthase family protein [Pseudonocardia kujensis]MCE0764158.1 dihydrodipicolinate synthase family protein [Pseudonocardia kujensis]